jgi:hypothetical protein
VNSSGVLEVVLCGVGGVCIQEKGGCAGVYSGIS